MQIDIPLPVGFADEAFVSELEKLEPFGVGNPKPLFAQKDVPLKSIQLVGKTQNVLKLVVEGADAAGKGVLKEAVYFGDTKNAYEQLKDRKTVSLLYQLQLNEYNGKKNVQLLVKDFY
jgi:single-stranded-DNA-specific exonuclease